MTQLELTETGHTGRRLRSTEEAREFILAGNATVTLVSTKTGVRYTYKITESEDGGRVFFVSVMRGSSNEDFEYLGIITRLGLSFRLTAKSCVGTGNVLAEAWMWSWEKLRSGTMPVGLEVWHEGKCGRCARKLTTPESIERGIGPECWKEMKR